MTKSMKMRFLAFKSKLSDNHETLRTLFDFVSFFGPVLYLVATHFRIPKSLIKRPALAHRDYFARRDARYSFPKNEKLFPLPEKLDRLLASQICS